MQRVQHDAGVFVTDGHLGGYYEGGDPWTTYPIMWKWLIESQHVESVLDVGCGDGGALNYFQSLGVDAYGIDGVPQDDDRIAQHDFTQGPFWTSYPDVDLVWSCEFVEHVEEQYVPNFLPAFACGKLVAMTYAAPGQGGHHHVNCRTADYWIGAFAAIGYRLDQGLRGACRALALKEPSIPADGNHFGQRGLVFRRG